MTVDLCSQQSWSCPPHWKPFKVGPQQQGLISGSAPCLPRVKLRGFPARLQGGIWVEAWWTGNLPICPLINV